MSYAYNAHAAAFAKLDMMRKFYSEIPDLEGFIQNRIAQLQDEEDVHFINNEDDFKAWKQKYEIKLSCGPMEFSDEDSDCAEDSDPERKAGLLLDEKKIKEKAEKKRLKKRRQKERKRLEKQQNAKQDNETLTSQTCNGDEDNLNLKDMASALDSKSDSSSDESGNEEDEGLDLTSCFVSKAAEIAKRKLQKQENKDKKKSPVKDEPKTPEKTLNETNGGVKKVDNSQDTITSSPKMEDFVKISAEFAMMGSKLAGAGDYKTAVRYFTDAIKYNPTEYRLFGNRAFCFERMQEYDKSLSDAELSLSMNPGWVKGLFRKGRALAGLKRYKEAACAFKEVLELDSSGTEAAQDLMRVQIMQIMEYGFTQEQSINALVIHGNAEKALEALSKTNNKPVSPPAPVPLQQVANVTGVSPGLSAKAAAAPRCPPPAQDVSKTRPENKPLIPVQIQQSHAKATEPVAPDHVVQTPELFPVWVGNLSLSVTENLLRNLFNKVGTVYSIKQLSARRCAFINFTEQQHCDDAIRRYHGFELMGSKLAVRYPDRIPPGLNISRAAHKANEPHDDNFRYNLYVSGRTGSGKPYHHNYRDAYKY